MRIITEKDKQALLPAFRCFVRAMSGERISNKAGTALLERALDGGLSFDEILNKGNWERAKSLTDEGETLTAEQYIDALLGRSIEVKELREEPLWYEPQNGFTIVAEAAHDFFMEITGKGGKWNTPSAMTNLAKAIQKHSLQAVLSEELIMRLTDGMEPVSTFAYIKAIVDDFNSLDIDTSPTEAQLERAHVAEESLRQMTEEPVEEGDEQEEEEEQEHDPYLEEAEEEEIPPEDEPFPPYPGDEGEQPIPNVVETAFFVQSNPRDMKRDCITAVLENYSMTELLSLTEAIDGGSNLPLSGIIDRLTDGQVNVSKESPEARQVHLNIIRDLMPSFIETVRMQGLDMDDEMAAHYDILKDSWDLRTEQVRKLYKIKRLVMTYAKDDPDLLSALDDIEALYAEK